jgi:predicted HAD superfamily phosphohydrolase
VPFVVVVPGVTELDISVLSELCPELQAHAKSPLTKIKPPNLVLFTSYLPPERVETHP